MSKLTTEELDRLQFGRVIHTRPGGETAERDMSTRENIERVEWTMQDPAWVPSRDYLAKVLAAYKEAVAENERLRVEVCDLRWHILPNMAEKIERLRKIAQMACDETFEKQTKLTEAAARLDKLADRTDRAGPDQVIDVAAECRVMAHKLRGKEP